MIPRSAFLSALSALAVTTTSSAAALATYERNLIFQPPETYTDPRVLYPRTLQLADGRLLATWENYSPEPPLVWFPIHESLDGGLTWAEVGQVHDQANNWGLRYQPFLYELRQPFAGYPAGTLLLAGNSIPTDLSQTRIDLYASTDTGRTWEFVSHVAAGGRAVPNNEETPVWEPFVLIFEDELILYYADQRSPDHGQELSHQTTKDLKTWSDVVIDVSYPTYTDRPGMPFVAQLGNDGGDYMYVFEWGGAPIIEPYSFPIYYRIAKDPRKFAEAPDMYINSTTITNNSSSGSGGGGGSGGGVFPINSPNVVWSPVGGRNGTIVVSSNSAPLFINRRGGDPGAWVAYESPEPGAYTRNLRIMDEDPDYLLIMGAGVLPPSTTNKITVSMVRLTDLST